VARGTIALAGPVVANCPLIPKLVSSVPLAVYRVTNPLASKSEAARAEATKIFPLGRSASAVALSPASLAPFPLPKVGSGSPSDKKRRSRKRSATTILPSGSTPTALVSPGIPENATIPAFPNVGSRLPFVAYRTTSMVMPPPPTATIFPSVCRAIAVKGETLGVTAMPELPNLGSKLPSVL